MVPPETVWAGNDAARTVTVVCAGRTVLADVDGEGQARVRQLLSTDPRDFLEPAFAPGASLPATRLEG